MLDDANYFGATNSLNFTISPKGASVTADAKTKTYGDANPPLTATVAGTVNVVSAIAFQSPTGDRAATIA